MLQQAGIAACEKQGKEVRYCIRYRDMVATLRAWADAIEQCCPDDNTCCVAIPEDGTADDPLSDDDKDQCDC